VEHAIEIIEESRYQPRLFEAVSFVETDLIKAKKVYDAIIKQFSEETYWDIYRTYLSNNHMKDTYILRYLIMAFRMGQKIELLHAHHDTLPVRRLSRTVGFEKHRFLGLLRFAEVDHVLYAAFEPDHNILILLGEHFADRLANERFVIHDVKRGQAIFCDHGEWIISDFTLEKSLDFSDNELVFQALWKGYFEAISIESRKNLKLQQSFVPLKYRKHLTEFH